MMTPQFILSASRIAFLSSLLLASCAHDSYQQRADEIKDHVEAFYAHLKANRVEAAIHENEQIEAMASQLGETVRKQVHQTGTTHVTREFELLKTANETAAQNWLALAQYFAIKKQYAQARATYRRVMDTYTDSTAKSYREQAARGLRDLDLVNPPTPHS